MASNTPALCDYTRGHLGWNELAVQSKGTTTLKGTWTFDFDTGVQGPPGGSDLWWQQVNTVTRYLVPQSGAMLAHMGKPNFDAVSLQPNAGSQGEYAGLLVIREYHRARGEAHRNVCLIPQSAHGTNPASAVMAGMKVVVVKASDETDADAMDRVNPVYIPRNHRVEAVLAAAIACRAARMASSCRPIHERYSEYHSCAVAYRGFRSMARRKCRSAFAQSQS